MDALGWIVAIVILLIFGKHMQLTANIPLDNSNAVPTVADNLPVMSIQDNSNSPANQPAPWRNVCDQNVANPISGAQFPLNISIPVRVPNLSPPSPVARPRVTFNQP